MYSFSILFHRCAASTTKTSPSSTAANSTPPKKSISSTNTAGKDLYTATYKTGTKKSPNDARKISYQTSLME